MQEVMEQEEAQERGKTVTIHMPPMQVYQEYDRQNLPNAFLRGIPHTQKNLMGEVEWTGVGGQCRFLHDTGYHSDMIVDRVKGLAVEMIQNILIAGGVEGSKYLMRNLPPFPGIKNAEESRKIAVEVCVRIVKLYEE